MKLDPWLLYNKLEEFLGHQNWWPIDKIYHLTNKSDYRFEIIVGAILTQNTSWSNVEKALINLKLKKILDIENIIKIHKDDLKKIIKNTGFYNQKTMRLKNIATYFDMNYDCNLDKFFNRNINEIREELLSLNGIGKETADSILLYAGSKCVFVVDAYTKRISKRLDFNCIYTYDGLQKFFENEFKKKKFDEDFLRNIFNEFHALIVIFSKEICKKNPVCRKCFINNYCKFGKNRL